MNWSKAKNIIIISFLILNIILFFIIDKEKTKYILSSEEISNIYSLLNKNNIIYENKPLIKNYKPMRQIKGCYELINTENIIDIFIKDKKNIEKYIQGSFLVFENDTERLTICDNKVIYRIKENFEEKNYSKEEEFANSIIKKLNKKLNKNNSFFKDNEIEEEDKKILKYREKYKKNIIYDNYILFKFNMKNLESIEYYRYDINNFVNKPREIVPLGNIILTFVQKVRNVYEKETIKIEKIDIVYSKINIKDNKNITMIPFYRIYYKLPNLNEDIYNIMLINAYTNEIY